jgi:hypothetical protein
LVDWRAAVRVARRLCCCVATISSRESESRLSTRRIPATPRNRGFLAAGRRVTVLCVYVVMTQMVVIKPCLRNRRRYQIPPVDGKGFPTRGVSTGLMRWPAAASQLAIAWRRRPRGIAGPILLACSWIAIR